MIRAAAAVPLRTTGARRPFRFALLALTAVLAGCASERPPVPVALSSTTPTLGAPVPTPSSALPSLADLPGWREEDHAAALRAFQDGCTVSRDPALRAVCARARALGPADELAARVFLETNFRPAVLPGPGLLTAYFAPEYPARTVQDPVFSAPVLGRPDDLVIGAPDPAAPSARRQVLQRGPNGESWPYPDRAGLELTAPEAPLAWMRPEDLFFLQIQGSGVLDFPDGAKLKAAYAGDNGRPFVAIAPAMVRHGLLAPGQASASSIRAWLRSHAGPQAQAVMDLDPRYVFFTLAPDDGASPTGAAGAPLTAGRAIAVDPLWHGYGELYWLDAEAPALKGAVKRYRRLAMALDTGAAIRGQVRADLYLGRGEQAGEEAGRVRHTLLLVRLVPIDAGGGREAAAAF